jgi:glycine cleavage system transcriptional repressor
VAELAVTAIGADRPGIVAAVAEVLRDHGGNVEDSAMTILRGCFAMMLLVETDAAADELRAEIVAAVEDLDLEVSVAPAGQAHEAARPTHVLSVYGSDRPGIIAGVARCLADLDVNITDLSTRMLPPDDQPVYAMVLEVAVPGGLDDVRLEAALRDVGEELGVDHTLRPLDTETY